MLLNYNVNVVINVIQFLQEYEEIDNVFKTVYGKDLPNLKNLTPQELWNITGEKPDTEIIGELLLELDSKHLVWYNENDESIYIFDVYNEVFN